MLLRLFGEDGPLMDHSKDRFKTGDAKSKERKGPSDGVEEAAVEANVDGSEDSEDDGSGGVKVVVDADGDLGDVGAAGLEDVVQGGEGRDEGEREDAIVPVDHDEVRDEEREDVG